MTTTQILAPYACHPQNSRGRHHPEADSLTRSPFQRDRDRLIHTEAFRKLKYKTQVFVYHDGDNFRTRLTHSLEVSQIARTICRVLGLNEDLGEALALGHDLGHTPFGHAGEDALQEMTAAVGGFDHNAQSLRIVTKLERRYFQFEGLNLTWETLEGLVKHNGPLAGIAGARPLSPAIASYNAKYDLELHHYASAEAQVASLSDDIAYNNHDIDDGLRAGLFTVGDLAEVPLVGPVFAEVLAEFPGRDESLHIHESVRRLIGLMVGDLIAETRRRISDLAPQSADEVRRLGRPLVAFSDEMRENDRALKSFLFHHMYRHYKVNRMASKARRVVKDLYTLLAAEPECLPPEWQRVCEGKGPQATARAVADYIAGMTDRYALDEYRRLFDMQETP
ncbi:MAG TPA: deoxyguanosinetriphosphate triphosphohydrolase [Rhodospirillaceae bacterium]|nr:deoxyguanosinetriphosphate triphosphohydrolase [Rhodospirillaceae bacterium]